jgi:phosphoribosylglycinamide formyltransferase 1
MTLNLGWFSSGKDESARALLSSIVKKEHDGLLDISIKFVFCNWEEGEEPQHPDYSERQRFFQLVHELGIPLVTLSWKRFRDSLRTGSKEEWRAAYGEMMRTQLDNTPFDLGILAGYNLWIDRDTCARYSMLNLYPSLPGGPLGTEQEVISQVITQKAGMHGIAILLCSPEQEAGIPLSYCSFPTHTPEYRPLWEQLFSAIDKRMNETISKDQVETSALFQKIMNDTKAREPPLLAYTIRMVAERRVKILNGRVHEGDSLMKNAHDLTALVDQALANKDF